MSVLDWREREDLRVFVGSVDDVVVAKVLLLDDGLWEMVYKGSAGRHEYVTAARACAEADRFYQHEIEEEALRKADRQAERQARAQSQAKSQAEAAVKRARNLSRPIWNGFAKSYPR